jgi:hypothetical protein
METFGVAGLFLAAAAASRKSSGAIAAAWGFDRKGADFTFYLKVTWF